jgi:hypothetical protein
MTTYNNNSYHRSMFGVTSIDADSVDTTNLVCSSLVINDFGTAPTVANGDNSNNIATTAWVSDHAVSLTLQNVYDNSASQPQIIIDSNGALQIKSDGVQANTFELLDSAGSTVLSVSEDGLMYANDIHVNDINGNNANGEINIGLTLNSGIIGIGNTDKMTIDQDGDVTINLLKTNDIDFKDIGSNMNVAEGAMIIQPTKEINVYGLFRANTTFVGAGISFLSDLRCNKCYFNNINTNMIIGSNDGTGKIILGGHNCPQLSTLCSVSLDDDIANKKYVDDNINNPTCTTIICDDFDATSVSATVNLFDNLTSGHIILGGNQSTGDITLGSSLGTGNNVILQGGTIDIKNHWGDLKWGLSNRNSFGYGNNIDLTAALDMGLTCTDFTLTASNSVDLGSTDVTLTGAFKCDDLEGSGASALMKIGNNVTTGNMEIAKNLNSGSGVTLGSLASGSSTTLNGGNILINASNGDTQFVANSYLMKSFLAGVFLVDSTSTIRMFPLYYTCANLNNLFQQTNTAGTTGAVSQSGGSVVGTWSSVSVNNIIDKILIMPNYGIIAYADTSFGGTIRGDFKNDTLNPIGMKLSTLNDISSIKVYWNDEEQLLK